MGESDSIPSNLLPEVAVSDLDSVEPVESLSPSSSSLNMDEDNAGLGGSLSTSLLKRKRSDEFQDESFSTTLGVFLFLLSNEPLFLTW